MLIMLSGLAHGKNVRTRQSSGMIAFTMTLLSVALASIVLEIFTVVDVFMLNLLLLGLSTW